MKARKYLLGLLLSLCLVSCNNFIGSNNSEELKFEDVSVLHNIKIDVQSNNERTLTSMPNWSLSDVATWEVTFKNAEGENKKSFSGTSGEFGIPFGKYDIEIEGKLAGNFSLYGKTSFEFTSKGNSSVAIAVGPKRVGKGSFSYTLKTYDYVVITQEKQLESNVTKFSGFLTSVNNTSNTISLNVSKLLSDEYKYGLFTFNTENTIPSGFYYLTILYDNTINVGLPDTLIEIVDDQETTASYTQEFINDTSIKTIYVNNNESLSGNGIAPFNASGLDSTLEKLKNNKSDWTNVVLHYVGEQDAPKLDVTKNPTVEGDGKVVSINWIQKNEKNVLVSSSIELKNGDILINKNLYKISLCSSTGTLEAPTPVELYTYPYEVSTVYLDNVLAIFVSAEEPFNTVINLSEDFNTKYNTITVPAYCIIGGSPLTRRVTYKSGNQFYNGIARDATIVSGIEYVPKIVSTDAMLWNASTCIGDNVENVVELSSMNTDSLSSLTSGIQAFENISANQGITSSLIDGLSDWFNVKCFCIDPKTGDMYISVESSSNHKSKIYKYDSMTLGEKITTIASDIEFTPTSMAYLDNNLYMLNVSINEQYADDTPHQEYFTSSISILDTQTGTFTEASDINQNAFKFHYSHKLLAIASDGESIYTIDSDVANFSVVKANLDAVSNNGVYKSYVSADFMVWKNKDNSNNSIPGYLKYGDVVLQSTYIDSYCKVTDLIAMGDSLYVLFNESCPKDSLQNCRGGVLRLSKETMGERLPFANGSYVLGWYEGQTTTDEVTIYNPLNALNYSGDLVLKTDVFYRPTRFVAIKPNVLVIADESAVFYNEAFINTNRIVTVDLSTCTLSGVNVKASLGYKYDSDEGFTNY